MNFKQYNTIKEIAADDARKQYPASSKAFFFASKLREEELKAEATKLILSEYNSKKLDRAIHEAVSALGTKEGKKIVYAVPEGVESKAKYIVAGYDQVWYYQDFQKEDGFSGYTYLTFEERVRLFEAL